MQVNRDFELIKSEQAQLWSLVNSTPLEPLHYVEKVL